jgi:SAM-dependent methyltransferase
MTYVLYVLAALLLLDGVRMRRRANALAVLAPSDDPASERIVTASGVTLDEATRRAASAFARGNGFDVVDLVPRDLPAIRAMTLLQLVDPPRYSTDRIGAGRTAGHALLVTNELANRGNVTEPADDVGFTRLAARLKHYGRMGFAIAPAEHARQADLRQRYEILRTLIGPTTTLAMAALPMLWALIGIGVWLRPLPGLIALGAWHLQPLLALAGTKLRPRDLPLAFGFRLPIELWLYVATVFGRRATPPTPVATADYDQLIANGTEAFYEPRRTTCPLCGAADLVVHLRNSDLLQRKPGVFTLERCRACELVFQNPRLSLAGLDFYYKDFYDGLGEAGMEFIFGFGAQPYHARAKMVRELAQPATWLDVGAGHGHFCIAAREDLPDTRFDGLDLSESIEEAKRRGWVDTAYRGLFPDLASQLAGRYDAISMSHYLEHTLDPRAELAAAHTALAPAGCLLIEVPDPEFFLGRWLGRYWLPWFQPQHLNLVPAKNLERLLREQGFTPVAWHRGPAHQRVDFFFAAWLLLNRLAPSPHLPWRKRGAVAGAWHRVVWTLGSGLIIAGVVVDNLVGPLFTWAQKSNTYRVVARKEAAA